MKRGSTLFLRSVIYLIGTAVLVFCVTALPAGIMSDRTGMYRPILLGLYVTCVPFYFALFESLKLLSFIDKDIAFSELSVNALRKIKLCAAVISLMFAAGMPYIYYVADKDDAPGPAALGFVIIFASMVIAVFAAVLQKLLQNAVEIKSENDLTV